MSDILKNKNTDLALFADNTAIIASSRNSKMDCTYTTRHLDEITKYFSTCKLTNFNKKKQYKTLMISLK